MTVNAIVSPREGRDFGVLSACFVFLLVVAEIEILVGAVVGVRLQRPDLFVALQAALVPGASLVGAATAGVVLWRAREWKRRLRRYTVELTQTRDLSKLIERVGQQRPP